MVHADEKTAAGPNIRPAAEPNPKFIVNFRYGYVMR